MSELDFNIGAKIHCEDGDCGKLDKLVFDPYKNEVTGLIVKEGTLFKTNRVLPVSLITRASLDDIYLSIKRERYEGFPEYRKFEYEVANEVPSSEENLLEGSFLMRANPYGTKTPTSFLPRRMRKEVHENVAEKEEVLEKSTSVLDLDGKKLGRLDHVLLDQNTCKLNHIIIKRGAFNESKVIPASNIDSMTEDEIIVTFNEQTLETFPSYIPREDSFIQSEIQDYMRQQIELENIGVEVEDGILTLTGYVKDILIKRRLESATRSIRGVIDVNNHLYVDDVIGASVYSSLARNPITNISVIEVSSEKGVVTLQGQIDHEEIRHTADDIAKIQPGVNRVDNQLKVEHDELTPTLQNRQGWRSEETR